jgi:predicted component of type VI protein secretion system
MAKLIAQSGHSLDLPNRRVILGESPSCDIPLAAGNGLAPRHFEIEPTADGGFILRDVSEGSGLSLNGHPVKEQALQHGNVITAGNLSLGFLNAPAPAKPSSDSDAGAERTSGEACAESSLQSAVETKALPVVETAVEFAEPAIENAATADPPAAGISGEPPAVQVEPPPVPPPSPPAMPAGPPVAWVNPAEENKPAVGRLTEGNSTSKGPLQGSRMGLSERLRRRARFAGRRMTALGVFAVLLIGAAAMLRIPSVQARITPLWTRFNAWVNPPPPTPRTSPPAAPVATASVSTKPAQAAGSPLTVAPRTEHNEIVKRMLTERTISLFQADLTQLIPFYNTSASSRNLPPQGEMTEAFRKHYGIVLDGFDRLTCLRSSGKDEFIFVLTSPARLNLESLLGLPGRPTSTATAGKKQLVRIYPVRTTGRVYGVAQVDPFTIVLGKQSWIDSALNGSDGPALREATCMFPDTAARQPGALIMVERLMPPAGDAVPLPFNTAVSNLFFKGRGESRLTLTRNPDVREETFVELSGEALREQSMVLHQTVKLSKALAAGGAAEGDTALKVVADSGEIINTAEASIVIPDGEALLREAIDAVAHTFMSQSPSVEMILAAQRAVLNFNQARLMEAPETQSVAGVAEALELLQNGIPIRRGDGARDSICQIERLEHSQAEEIVHLLEIEEGGRMVFRPNSERLSGALLDLAVKARDYRNAELIISLWNAAKLTGSDAGNAEDAARKIIEWANGPGSRQRLSVGLPALSAEEFRQAVALLTMQNGQLAWRPGVEGYRTWLRKVSPDPKGDAKRIAHIFEEAQRAGAIPSGRVSELSEAVHLINSGVRAGQGGRSPLFHTGNLTSDELRAAARYLRFDSGIMRVVDR